MKLSTENVTQNFALAFYVKQLTRLAYSLYDKFEADKVMKWVCIKYDALHKAAPRGPITKKKQLEIYLRSNEHTQNFMRLIDEKGLI